MRSYDSIYRYRKPIYRYLRYSEASLVCHLVNNIRLFCCLGLWKLSVYFLLKIAMNLSGSRGQLSVAIFSFIDSFITTTHYRLGFADVLLTSFASCCLPTRALASWSYGDISLRGHFAYRTFRLLDSSPTIWTFRLQVLNTSRCFRNPKISALL